MDLIPAVPPAGTGMAAVAEISRRRADGWEAFADVFTFPTPSWVDELRGGAVRQRLELAIGWREGELTDFGPPILTLGAFERSSRRRTADLDLERLTAAFGPLSTIGLFEEAGAACQLMNRLGRDEAVSWSAGRVPRARELRLRQSHELRGEAGDALTAACAEMVDNRPRQPYLSLSQLCGLWVDRERSGSTFAARS